MMYPVHVWAFDAGDTVISVANIHGKLYGVLELGLGLLSIRPTEAGAVIDNDGTLRRCVLFADRVKLDVPRQCSSSPPGTRRYNCLPLDVFNSFLTILVGRLKPIYRDKRDLETAVSMLRALKAYRRLEQDCSALGRDFTEQDALNFQSYLDKNMQYGPQVRLMVDHMFPALLVGQRQADLSLGMLEAEAAMKQTPDLKDRVQAARDAAHRSNETLTEAYTSVLELALQEY